FRTPRERVSVFGIDSESLIVGSRVAFSPPNKFPSSRGGELSLNRSESQDCADAAGLLQTSGRVAVHGFKSALHCADGLRHSLSDVSAGLHCRSAVIARSLAPDEKHPAIGALSAFYTEAAGINQTPDSAFAKGAQSVFQPECDWMAAVS